MHKHSAANTGVMQKGPVITQPLCTLPRQGPEVSSSAMPFRHLGRAGVQNAAACKATRNRPQRSGSNPAAPSRGASGSPSPEHMPTETLYATNNSGGVQVVPLFTPPPRPAVSKESER